MGNPVEDRIEQARRGENPHVIARLASGWLVLGETQPLPGYCQLLSDPPVASLNDMDAAARTQYLLDTVRVGDALLAITGAARINYETWCNLAPTLHTHIVPRYADEREDKRILPACVAYDFAAARKSEPGSGSDAPTASETARIERPDTAYQAAIPFTDIAFMAAMRQFLLG